MLRIIVAMVSLGVFAMILPVFKSLWDAVSSNTTGVMFNLTTSSFNTTVISFIPILIPLAFLGGLLIYIGRKKDTEEGMRG
jgi:hypothetical protein